MTKHKHLQFKSTREALLYRIEQFLKLNPDLTPEGFGWVAARDSSIVIRLRKGGDIVTRKLDLIIAFLANPNQTKGVLPNGNETEKETSGQKVIKQIRKVKGEGRRA